MSPSNAYPRRRMSWNVGRPPRSLALLRTSLAGRCRSPSPRPATLPPDAIEEVRETGVGRHVTELAPMSSAEALRGSAGARASPACPAGRADRCVHPLFRRRTRKAANSHKARLSAVAEGPMKLTTGWSGDSAQDLSRGCLRCPVPGKTTPVPGSWHRPGHRCQEPWHRRPRPLGTAGPALQSVPDGVNGLTRHDGSGTTHGRGEPAPDATGGALPICLARTTRPGQGPVCSAGVSVAAGELRPTEAREVTGGGERHRGCALRGRH